MPSPGKISRLRIPQGPGVRDDGGVYAGAEVSIHYDPMISKFAVVGRNREEAIERMRRALREYEIEGIKTTLPFFRQVMEDEVFVSGDLDTGFIEGFMSRRPVESQNQDERDLAIIIAALTDLRRRKAVRPASTIEKSRWAAAGRLEAQNRRIK
jgi:acetyl/propionyl-CoA carboxylase alpha subunit